MGIIMEFFRDKRKPARKKSEEQLNLSPYEI